MSPDMVETGSPEPEISKKFILTDRVDRADRVDTPQSPDQDDVLIIEDTPKSPEPETSTPGESGGSSLVTSMCRMNRKCENIKDKYTSSHYIFKLCRCG